jgi:FkbM family methyltransferase
MLSNEISSGDLYLFEANPIIFDMMVYNTENNINESINKHYYNNIVSDDYSLNKFPEPAIGSGSEFVTYGSFGVNSGPSTGNFFDVESICIDDLKLSNISCLKVDVEGFDLKVLRGCKETIIQNQCVFIFEFGGGANEENTFEEYEKFIDSINYKIHNVIKNDYLCIPK